MARRKNNTKVWDRLVAKMERSKSAKVKIGVLQGKGAESDHGGATTVQIATIHEYGAPGAGIPERSFIRSTFEAKQADVAKRTAKLAEAFLKGRISLEKGLDVLGAWGVAEVKKTIVAGIPPANAPATIAHKGSDKPLIDTGQLINSINFEVTLK